ncbi:MAG: hydantoinase/oxoprolinase family protein, partial [Micromonosporaceae bacterium]
FLQRQDRSRMYDLAIQKPTPLVSPEHIAEVPERVDAAGTVLRAPDPDRIRQALATLVRHGVDAVAVSLLHSYANPEHERAILAIARQEHPDLVVALSSQCAREFREYERTTTTTVDAFLRPRIASYLNGLAATARQLGIRDLQVMQSNGGVVPAQTAAANPLSMLRSGPAAGVAGAVAVAGAVGIHDIVTMDMGGTSTDVAVVHAGRPEQTAEAVADGLPLRVPMVDIVAVGAGGGSLVDIDSGGLLTVGPESAGAAPGPVCYGLGGVRATVTDANLVRGLIRPEAFLGGRHRLDRDAAGQALAPLAARVGRTPAQLAEDIYGLASVHMAGAIRIATTERGHDVEGHTLVAYGGAGPLHAATVAAELGITRVLVPPHPGLASAHGLLTAGFRREYGRTHLAQASELSDQRLAELARQLQDSARAELLDQGIELRDARYAHSVDMRYRGQGFEVTVDLPDAASASDAQAGAVVREQRRVAALVERFHQVHARRYGYSDPQRPVQLVTNRLTVTTPPPAIALPRIEIDVSLPTRKHEIVEAGELVPAVFRRRASLAVGDCQPGPAVIEDDTSTAFVPTGWTAHVDQNTNLILERR